MFLNNKLQSSTDFDDFLLATVTLPSFQCDREDLSTKNLIQQYKQQRKILEDIIKSELFINNIFEKLTETK